MQSAHTDREQHAGQHKEATEAEVTPSISKVTVQLS